MDVISCELKVCPRRLHDDLSVNMDVISCELKVCPRRLHYDLSVKMGVISYFPANKINKLVNQIARQQQECIALHFRGFYLVANTQAFDVNANKYQKGSII